MLVIMLLYDWDCDAADVNKIDGTIDNNNTFERNNAVVIPMIKKVMEVIMVNKASG